MRYEKLEVRCGELKNQNFGMKNKTSLRFTNYGLQIKK